MNTSKHFPMTFVWRLLVRTTLACSGRRTGTQEPDPFPPPDRTVLRGSSWRRVNRYPNEYNIGCCLHLHLRLLRMGRRIVHSFYVSDAAYGKMWQ
jgi:hypothetical protein